jgi:hypothetical protein
VSEAEFTAERIGARWYVNVNDLVGGWCIGTVSGNASEHRNAADIADMVMTREIGERIVADHDASLDLRRACEAALLFHRGGPWTDMDCIRWQSLTQSDEATAKVLCDTIRAALAKAEKP